LRLQKSLIFFWGAVLFADFLKYPVDKRGIHVLFPRGHILFITGKVLGIFERTLSFFLDVHLVKFGYIRLPHHRALEVPYFLAIFLGFHFHGRERTFNGTYCTKSRKLFSRWHCMSFCRALRTRWRKLSASRRTPRARYRTFVGLVLCYPLASS
jgi:hypothetical protein